MVRVKICGITNVEDALAACEAGADAIGFVFHAKSPRAVTPEEAALIIRQVPPFITTVGVFVNAPRKRLEEIIRETGIDMVQLHGDEPPSACRGLGRRVIKAVSLREEADLARLAEYRVDAYLVEGAPAGVYGGSGEKADWALAAMARTYGRVILAGGLGPENVAEAVAAVRPYAVDVSSGVESKPGKKDPERVRAFVREAKKAGESVNG